MPIKSFPLVLRPSIAAAIAATMLLIVTAAAARAESDECPLNPAAKNDLATIRAGDDKARIVAAASLTDKGIGVLPTVMEELTQFKGPTDKLPTADQIYFISITDVLRTIVSSGNGNDAIAKFRICRNPSVIKPLVWAASGANPNMRVNATLILGNVIDNTTVCFVLHHLLKDDKINNNGRANLLGVTVAMAGYAFKENVEEINKVLQSVQPKVKDQTDLVQTQNLISEIGKRVQISANAGISLDPALPKYCFHYDYNQDLD